MKESHSQMPSGDWVLNLLCSPLPIYSEHYEARWFQLRKHQRWLKPEPDSQLLQIILIMVQRLLMF